MKNLCFSEGELSLAEGSFSEEDFAKRLVSSNLLSSQQVDESSKYALENKISLLRALIERGVLPASRALRTLTEFWREDLGSLFDWPRADFFFDSSPAIPRVQVYALASTPEFIILGIRGMKNFDLIEAFLPSESASLQVLSPAHTELLKLNAPEKYVLSILPHAPTLQELYSVSQLGKKETQRAIFELLHLGVVGLTQPRNTVKPTPDFSSAGLEKIWGDFNDKCSFIFKYISKEIGPVGLNVVEKALDEVRAKLGPPLQGLELRADGRIELKPFPLLSLNLYNEESFKNFIRVLNEILVAEVLAVKKTLGNAHEAAVVKNLERIGDST